MTGRGRGVEPQCTAAAEGNMMKEAPRTTRHTAETRKHSDRHNWKMTQTQDVESIFVSSDRSLKSFLLKQIS